MLGTLINAGAILLGGFLGTATRLDLAAPRQQQLKVLLGVATTFFGLKLVWIGLASTGTARGFFRQLAVVLLAMVVGHLLGKVCRVQALFNKLGHDAKLKLERDVYMLKMNNYISERREEKKQGKRISANREFLVLAHQQTKYTPPRVGCWGWKKQQS